MAHIGMKYPVAAKWADGNKYTEGFVVAKAINFNGTPNIRGSMIIIWQKKGAKFNE